MLRREEMVNREKSYSESSLTQGFCVCVQRIFKCIKLTLVIVPNTYQRLSFPIHPTYMYQCSACKSSAARQKGLSSCVHQKHASRDNRICSVLNASKEQSSKCDGLKVYRVVNNMFRHCSFKI